MNLVFSPSKYVLKRKGLSIGGKYQLLDEQKNPLLFIEEKIKLIPPSRTVFAYADEKKTQLVLKIDLSESANGVAYDVIDSANGAKLGSLVYAVESLSDLVKDKWIIMDVDGQVIARMFEKRAGRAILRELTDHNIPQKLEIAVGETTVAELRQKATMLGYEATLDFSMDTGNLLDRRLGVAAAVMAALHQGSEEI